MLYNASMKRILLLSAPLLIASAACTGNVEGTGGSTSSSSSTGTAGGPPSDVNGSVVYTYHAESGATHVPASLAGAQVLAYVQEGGAWTTIAGSGHADGTFTVPQVPAGLF